MNSIEVATDGSAHPNPGPGGWAWVDQRGACQIGAFTHGTNNIGELLAIKYALLAHDDEPIVIVYDSHYAYACVTQWGPTWRSKGLTEKENLSLILEIMDLIARRQHDLGWRKVKAHLPRTDPEYDHLNATADLLAGRARKTNQNKVYEPTKVHEDDWVKTAATEPETKLERKKSTRVTTAMLLERIEELEARIASLERTKTRRDDE